MATLLAKSARVKPIHARAVKSAPASVRRAPKTFTPILQHALAVAGRHVAKDSRNRLKPGAYEVNTTVHIVGTLTVGHDKEVETRVAPSSEDVLAMAIDCVPAEQRANLIERLLRRAATGTRVKDPCCNGHARMIVELLDKWVVTARAGTVTGKFAVTPGA